jgi:hypothetical protein
MFGIVLLVTSHVQQVSLNQVIYLFIYLFIFFLSLCKGSDSIQILLPSRRHSCLVFEVWRFLFPLPKGVMWAIEVCLWYCIELYRGSCARAIKHPLLH